MKTTYYSLIISLLFISFGYSNPVLKNWKFKEEKKISKSFQVNSDALVNISNKYGSIFVTTWEGNSVSIEVFITVSSNSEKWVKSKIESIDVEFSNSASSVKAVTLFESSNSWNSNENNSIDVKYLVKIPKMNQVVLNQKYGEIKTQTLYNKATISCKYGKVDLLNLNGNDSQVSIEYCNGSSIGHFKSGAINAKYSKLNVTEFGDVQLAADYTDVNFGKGASITFQLDYGKLNFTQVQNVNGTGDYMGLKINELNGSLVFTTKYSSVLVDKINTQTNNININASYTNVKLSYPINYPFDVDVNVKYGDFSYDKSIINYTSEANGFDKKYQGNYLKRNVNTIKIVSKYGNVSLKPL